MFAKMFSQLWNINGIMKIITVFCEQKYFPLKLIDINAVDKLYTMYNIQL